MTDDPLDSPPADHGSDRYGYVELIGAPEGVVPFPLLVDSLLCPDCVCNLFLTYVGEAPPRHTIMTMHVWQPLVAHDDSCPTFARIQREQAG